MSKTHGSVWDKCRELDQKISSVEGTATSLEYHLKGLDQRLADVEEKLKELAKKAPVKRAAKKKADVKS